MMFRTCLDGWSAIHPHPFGINSISSGVILMSASSEANREKSDKLASGSMQDLGGGQL